MPIRSSFYNAANLPVQSTDLLGTALKTLIEDIITGSSINPMLSPLLATIRKTSTPSDVIRWTHRLTSNEGRYGALNTPAIYSQFPGTDNGVYADAGQFLPLELIVGGIKVWDMVRFDSDEMAVAMSAGIDAVSNLFRARYGAAVQGIIKTLNSHLIYGKTGSLSGSPIGGFQSIFDGTTYAGLLHTPAVYTGLLANVDYFPGWRPLTGTWTQADAELVLDDGHGASPNIVTDTEIEIPATANNLSSALQFFTREMLKAGKTFDYVVANPDIEFAYSKAYQMRSNVNIVNGQLTSAETGFGAATFQGMPFLADASLPADTIYFLDSTKLEFLTRGEPAIAQGSVRTPFEGLSISSGPLATDTVTIQRYEILTVPQLRVIDTSGISRLSIVATNLFA